MSWKSSPPNHRMLVPERSALSPRPILKVAAAPPAATGKALNRAGLTAADIDLFEVNEAFASVVLYFMDKTKVPCERINVAGGAIAMGHPVGATGAVLIGTLINEMQRRSVEYGVVTMCTGLGMGVATVVQRV